MRLHARDPPDEELLPPPSLPAVELWLLSEKPVSSCIWLYACENPSLELVMLPQVSDSVLLQFALSPAVSEEDSSQ